MAKPYKELRKLMYGESINQEQLAEHLGRCTTYVSMRMRGVAPWDMLDVYRICELLEIPTDKIAVYFPREDIKVS